MKHTLDWLIIGPYLLLSLLGILVLSSVTPEKVLQQIVLLIIGFIIMIVIGQTGSALAKQVSFLSYFGIILLLLATYIFGDAVRGSVRWIDIFGFRFQTSEIAKPFLILAFSAFLDRYPPNTFLNIGKNILSFLLPTTLIFFQPDLGTALVLFAIWISMLFMADMSAKLFAGGGLLFGIATYFSPHFLKPYQLERLSTFFDPYQDPLGSGYNVIQAIIAVGSGQIWGKGLGKGTQSHFRFLPERHTDFVFASLTEELGLVGGLGIVVLISTILWRLLTWILNSHNNMDRLILTGVFGYLFFQATVNIGMNIGIMPVTGVALPLVSYGGSSVLATSLALGLALAAARSSKQQAFLEIK